MQKKVPLALKKWVLTRFFAEPFPPHTVMKNMANQFFIQLPSQSSPHWEAGSAIPAGNAVRRKRIVEISFETDETGELILRNWLKEKTGTIAGEKTMLFIPGMMGGRSPVLDLTMNAMEKHYGGEQGVDNILWLLWDGDAPRYRNNLIRVAALGPEISFLAKALAGTNLPLLCLFAASMGARIADLLVHALPVHAQPHFSSCILAAADLPADYFSHAENTGAFSSQCTHTRILTQKRDRVLMMSARINGGLRLGQKAVDEELLPPRISVTDFSSLKDLRIHARLTGHSYFRDSSIAAGRIREMLRVESMG